MVNSLLLTPTIFPCCEQCWRALYGAPENLLIFGESGGIGRPNNDGVVGQCDPIAERDCKGTAKMAFFHGSYALSEVKVDIALIMSIKEAPPTDVRAEVRY